jgi:hypothetical protein
MERFTDALAMRGTQKPGSTLAGMSDTRSIDPMARDGSNLCVDQKAPVVQNF